MKNSSVSYLRVSRLLFTFVSCSFIFLFLLVYFLFFFLFVSWFICLIAEARAEIAGPAEKFVRPGSTLQLHCLVKKSTETPSYLFWYHNFRMINYDVDRGVNVSTDLLGRESWLEVPRASGRHSGNYTCEASNAAPGRAYVHIFDGENPAAMQHSLGTSVICQTVDKTTIILALLIVLSRLIVSTTCAMTGTTKTKLKLILDCATSSHQILC